MSAGPGFVLADLLERSITRPLLDFFANISDLGSRYRNGDFFYSLSFSQYLLEGNAETLSQIFQNCCKILWFVERCFIRSPQHFFRQLSLTTFLNVCKYNASTPLGLFQNASA